MGRGLSLRAILAVAAMALLGLGILSLVHESGESDEPAAEAEATACAESEAQREAESGDALAAEAKATEPDAGGVVGDLYRGPVHEVPCAEGVAGHPESFTDLALANSSRLTREVAPGTQLKDGAYRSSIGERASMKAQGRRWHPYGKAPLQSNRTQYDTSGGATRQGLGDLSGRINGFTKDRKGNIYAAVANGGVWKSRDRQHWKSIGEKLPTQVIGSIVWTKAGGGTLVVLTGDRAYGGSTTAGLGVYRTKNNGRTWKHSRGIRDGLLGFRLAIDPTNPKRIYAATGGGLFRSTNAGRRFKNVWLPTGANAPSGTPNCTGKRPAKKNCFLANMVTDVVVQGKGNDQTQGGKPGAVMAAVGWRSGTKPNAAGAQQSPGNGIYVSTKKGRRGTFENMDLPANSIPTTDPLTQARVGRIALGIAAGPKQDHRIVYALVQDAVKFNGGALGLDANENGTLTPAYSDYLNGVWVSTDFGQSWRELEGSTTIDNDITTNSALAPPVCKAPAVISYCPGIQAWYNLWVSPDPTQATAAGVPTRVAFGLEEVWANDPAVPQPTGIDGTTPARFAVIGRYYAGDTCTLLNATNGLPVCPTGNVPAYTTHPDQHAALWLPDGRGGVTLMVGNDGGVYKQHVKSGGDLAGDAWGQGKRKDPNGARVSGANNGLNTLLPYDAAMSRNGTLYMGLQDNGEAKVKPNGAAFTIFGGDGFFTAVHPRKSRIAYEEYVGGDIAVTTDGGKTWDDIQPANLTSAQFSTPFEMDPANPDHLMVGGRDIEETMDGPGTTGDSWTQVYDLGTRQHPGDGTQVATDTDPNNQLSAVDVLSRGKRVHLPTGPRTRDKRYRKRGADTIPGLSDQSGLGIFVPGSYNDYDVQIGKHAGDASMTINATWADSANDWDLYLYREEGGSLVHVDDSAHGGTTKEKIQIPNPKPGHYVARVANWEASGTYDLAVSFTQRKHAGARTKSSAYVGYCGFCDTITQGTPFGNGIATNVGGKKPGAPLKHKGWHIARAKGLPERYITSVRMDPTHPSTVYATLAGYGRRWAFPGAQGEDTSHVGTGHVFMSTNAGKTFRNISGNLPDTPANWSVIHGGHLIVGTDIGVFRSCNSSGGPYSVLGRGLPTAPVATMSFQAGHPNRLVTATYGRGVYTYRFGSRPSGVCHG